MPTEHTTPTEEGIPEETATDAEQGADEEAVIVPEVLPPTPVPVDPVDSTDQNREESRFPVDSQGWQIEQMQGETTDEASTSLPGKDEQSNSPLNNVT